MGWGYHPPSRPWFPPFLYWPFVVCRKLQPIAPASRIVLHGIPRRIFWMWSLSMHSMHWLRTSFKNSFSRSFCQLWWHFGKSEIVKTLEFSIITGSKNKKLTVITDSIHQIWQMAIKYLPKPISLQKSEYFLQQMDPHKFETWCKHLFKVSNSW